MQSVPKLDPVLADLLQSIRESPRARLFQRSPAHSAALNAGERLERSVREARLLSAERELLRVHRAEVALFLRQAAALLLDRAPRAELVIFDVSLPERTDWERRRRAAEDAGLPLRLEGLPATFSPARAEELARLSLEFQEHPAARAYVGMSWILSGQFARAEGFIERARLAAESSAHERYFLELRADALSKQGQDARASELYREAAERAPEALNPRLFGFVAAALAGRSQAAVEFAGEIEALVEGQRSNALSHVLAGLTQVRAAQPILSDDSLRALRALADRVGPTSARLLHALL